MGSVINVTCFPLGALGNVVLSSCCNGMRLRNLGHRGCVRSRGCERILQRDINSCHVESSVNVTVYTIEGSTYLFFSSCLIAAGACNIGRWCGFEARCQGRGAFCVPWRAKCRTRMGPLLSRGPEYVWVTCAGLIRESNEIDGI